MTENKSRSIPHPNTFADPHRLSLIKGYVLHEKRTPGRKLPIVTPHQTIGPFHPRFLIKDGDNDLAAWSPDAPRAEGEPIVISGILTDETGRPVPGALIEIWSANSKGKYDHPADTFDQAVDPNFKGFGRTLTKDDGYYRFVSIKPGAYPNPGYDNWWRPPHVHFSVYAAGVMHRLITQMYFPNEPLNDEDPILNSIEDLEARQTLICTDGGYGPDGWQLRFDITLRGRQETQFFIENGE